MRACTEKEFNLQCDYWYKQPHLTDDEKVSDRAIRHIIVVYIPSKQELHEWRITPSSEDKVYSPS